MTLNPASILKWWSPLVSRSHGSHCVYLSSLLVRSEAIVSLWLLLWLSFSNGLSNQDSLFWKEPDEWAPHYLTRTRTHHVGSPFNNYVVGLELFFSTDPQYMDACVCHSIFHVTWASPFHQTKTERWRLSLYLDRDPMDDETKKRRWAGSGLDSDEPHLLATNKLSQASHVWHAHIIYFTEENWFETETS